MRRICLTMLLATLAACDGPGRSDGEAVTVDEVTIPSGPDPCSLVSASEMEALLGPLAEPPFRVDDDRNPKVEGEGCFYRARDRRNVTLEVDWEDGALSFQMLAGTGQAITDILSGYDPVTDTLDGEWDRVGAPFGRLIALKGTVSVQIDPLGSRIGTGGAARLAALALGRIDAPLEYSGARATLARRETPAPARNPCELVTREEVEALMGPLAGDPRPSADGSECDYPTPHDVFGSQLVRTLTVVWRDGFHAFGQERMAVAGATQIMAAQVDPDLPELSDTTTGASEPWDERITLVGGVVTVVKADVMLQFSGDAIGGFSDARALEMLRIAVRRI